jgi:hypothetical protein
MYSINNLYYQCNNEMYLQYLENKNNQKPKLHPEKYLKLQNSKYNIYLEDLIIGLYHYIVFQKYHYYKLLDLIKKL